jgi:hypothetical protein
MPNATIGFRHGACDLTYFPIASTRKHAGHQEAQDALKDLSDGYKPLSAM